MQTFYWCQICPRLCKAHHLFPRIQAPFVFHQTQRFASQQPGFGSNAPSSSEPRLYKSNTPGFGSGKPTSQSRKPFGEEKSGEHKGGAKAEQPKTEKTWRSWRSKWESEAKSNPFIRAFRPRRIILFFIFGYVAVKVVEFHTDPYRCRVLDPNNFMPFILETRDRVSSTSSILNLQSLPKGQNTENVAEAWRTGIWSVLAMQPELQIARSYTPLPPAVGAEPEQLRLFVRKEPQGEVSSFLHTIYRGTLVHLRGPRIEYTIPEDVDEVLFLAGGTGIAPALQVAHVLYEHRISPSGRSPKLRILWANRQTEDSFQKLETSKQRQAILTPKHQSLVDKGEEQPEQDTAVSLQQQTRLVQEVEMLKTRHPNEVEINYLIDEEYSYITESLLRKSLRGMKLASEQSHQDHPADKKLLLISGPEGFVDFYAGPKSMKGGREIQGPLGGMLRKIGPTGWEIWKL